MKIGIDISALQGAHRMRGIGYVVANFLRTLPEDDDSYYFVFYLEESDNGIDEILKLIKPSDDRYEIRHFRSDVQKGHKNRYVRKLIKIFTKIHELYTYRFGDRRYPSVDDIDCFIQLDQSKPMPKLKHGANNIFIAYDLIPYILEADYLHNYRTARKLGRSLKSSLKAQFDRYIYIKKVRINVRRAHKILAISHTTKNDYINLANAPKSKIRVITLGVSTIEKAEHISKDNKALTIDRYKKTSWGYMPYRTHLEASNFLLFVGGADNRRRLQDLVTAFNHLKARGYSELKLVLSGDIMQGPLNIPNESVQKSLLESSYKDDIYYLGFTDDSTRNWIYEHALAFIFPSVYEGFGLPVLEAMGRGTPVICYKNSAVAELTGDVPFFTSSSIGIAKAIYLIRGLRGAELAHLRDKGVQLAAQYTWESTSEQILEHIKN